MSSRVSLATLEEVKSPLQAMEPRSGAPTLTTPALDEFQHYDFGVGTQADWGAPGAGAAGGEDLHFSDAAQAVDELAIHAAGHPAPGNELAEVRVPGELEGNSSGFGGFGMIGSMD